MTSYDSFDIPHLRWLTTVADEYGVRTNVADFELQEQDNAYLARGVP